MCFAKNENKPMLDTNAIRVVKRFFGVTSSKLRPRADPELWEFLERLIPQGKGRDLNLAIIDFAALLCKAKQPKCLECPVSDSCTYYNEIGRGPRATIS